MNIENIKAGQQVTIKHSQINEVFFGIVNKVNKNNVVISFNFYNSPFQNEMKFTKKRGVCNFFEVIDFKDLNCKIIEEKEDDTIYKTLKIGDLFEHTFRYFKGDKTYNSRSIERATSLYNFEISSKTKELIKDLI